MRNENKKQRAFKSMEYLRFIWFTILELLCLRFIHTKFMAFLLFSKPFTIEKPLIVRQQQKENTSKLKNNKGLKERVLVYISEQFLFFSQSLKSYLYPRIVFIGFSLNLVIG